MFALLEDAFAFVALGNLPGALTVDLTKSPGDFFDGSVGSVQQREPRDTRDFLGSGTSSRRRCQYQEGKEARKCCNNTQNKANRCFCTTILFKLQDWYGTGNGYHTSLQDDGNKPMMDLAQSLQTWCVYEHVAASI